MSTAKKAAAFRLSAEAREKLERLAAASGISQAAVLEQLIRREAKRAAK